MPKSPDPKGLLGETFPPLMSETPNQASSSPLLTVMTAKAGAGCATYPQEMVKSDPVVHGWLAQLSEAASEPGMRITVQRSVLPSVVTAKL